MRQLKLAMKQEKVGDRSCRAHRGLPTGLLKLGPPVRQKPGCISGPTFRYGLEQSVPLSALIFPSGHFRGGPESCSGCGLEFLGTVTVFVLVFGLWLNPNREEQA